MNLKKFKPFSKLFRKPSFNKIGTILTSTGSLSEDDLDRALEIKKQNPEKLLGQIIMEEGFASREAIGIALEQQRKEHRLGQILLSSGIISGEQLETALSEQRNSKSRLGDILVEKKYCTVKDISNSLRFQRRDSRLGTLLISKGYISQEDLEKALKVQADDGTLLGEVLVNLGLITSRQLTDILLLQSRMLLI